MTRKRHSKRKAIERQRTILFVVFVLIVVGIIIGCITFINSGNKFHPETGCSLDQPLQRLTVFLVDRSDNLSEKQQKDLRRILDNVYDNLEVSELLRVYSIHDQVSSIPQPIKEFCRPPLDADKANLRATNIYLEDNAAKLRKLNLEGLFDELVKPFPSNESPLMEWVKSISEDPSFTTRTLENRRLVIFSDMVQYMPSEGFKHCGPFPDFEDFRQTRYYDRISTKLDGVNVEILNVRRLQDRDQRTEDNDCSVNAHKHLNSLEDFWFGFFDDAGADISPRRFDHIRQ